MAGKGDTYRKVNITKYNNNYDGINWKINNMIYKYNKDNLLDSLSNLYYWVQNNFDESQSQALFHQLDRNLTEVENQFPDCFGTEGYEHTIWEK